MAYSRFLLLLIGGLFFYLPEAEVKPVNFWCKPEIRAKWKENAGDKIERMIKCQGSSDVQATTIQCPFVGINYQRWDNLTLLEKFSETVSDLQVLERGLEEAQNQTSLSCQPLLNTIKLHVRNNMAILQRQIQNATLKASSSLQTCSGLSEVLKRYLKLLQGKLELFVKSYADIVCRNNTTDLIGIG
ncbi:hypothetical protein NL108_002661 [Boleophthalmus pectinirostris]|nr:hypothetical protein NL108_002661 [Boleophthalmus pectinirostris]